MLRTCRIELLAVAMVVWAVCVHADERGELAFSRISGSVLGGKAEAVLREAYSRIGYDIASVVLPGARALAHSSEGLTDGELERVYAVGEQFPTLIRVEPAILELRGMAIVKGDDSRFKGVESLRSRRVGIKLGIVFARNLVERHGLEFVEMGNLTKLLEMLEKGRLDVVIADRASGSKALSDLGLKDVTMVKTPLVVHKLYHYLHMKHAWLGPKIGAVLARMKKDGELERIAAGYEEER